MSQESDELVKVLREMIAGIKEKSIGPDDSRQLDAESQAKTDERFAKQQEMQRTQLDLHRRSVEASERQVAAWNLIAESLAKLAARP